MRQRTSRADRHLRNCVATATLPRALGTPVRDKKSDRT